VRPLSGIDLVFSPELTRRHMLVGWILAAFLITFLVTRAVTKAIRQGRGPFRNTSVGGVHVHHQVYGIFLLLVVGTIEFTYRPDAPWVDILAALFGAGAALTLDEFALWLHLDDVYWAREGRSSVDAVLVASLIFALLLVGADPFDPDTGDGAPGIAVTVLINFGFAFVSILKGRTLLGVIGVFIPLLSLYAALRLARPTSAWARRRYDEHRMARARARFPAGRRNRWDRLVDLFASAPPISDLHRTP
jgi:hypothetical protein